MIFFTWEGTPFHKLATCHLHKDCSFRRFYILERWSSKRNLKWIPTISKPLTLLFIPFEIFLFLHILYKPLSGIELFFHSFYPFVLSLLVNLAQISIHLVDPGAWFLHWPWWGMTGNKCAFITNSDDGVKLFMVSCVYGCLLMQAPKSKEGMMQWGRGGGEGDRAGWRTEREEKQTHTS